MRPPKAADGALGQDGRAGFSCAPGDGGGSVGGFGAAVTGGEQGAGPVAGEAGHDAAHLVSGQQAAVDAHGFGGGVEPGFAFGQFRLGAAQIDDTAAAEAGFAADH
jgi:hypothetical protein